MSRDAGEGEEDHNLISGISESKSESGADMSPVHRRSYLSADLWGLPLFVALFAVTFTLFVFLATIYESVGLDIIPFAGTFIFLSAIFWLLDPFLKERLSIAVANITLIAIYLISAQALILASGGLTSPFFMVYYFVIFTGAMSYGLSGSIAVTALVAIAYGTFIESSLQLPPYVVKMIVLWIIALMVGFLAETKRRVEVRESLQNLRLTALSEIARFMRELSAPKDVIEAGLDAAVRLLNAESAAIVKQSRIITRSGRRADNELLDRGERFAIDLGEGHSPLNPKGSAHSSDCVQLVILRRGHALSLDEIRIVKLLIEKMQLIWIHLQDRAAIESARAEKERVMDSIGSAVLTLSEQGAIKTLNRKAVEIMGAGEGSIVGARVIVAPFNFPLPGEFGTESREVNIRTRNGETVPVEMRVMPQVDENGSDVGWIVVFNDLKELRRLKAIIHRSEALAAVGEMSARVAHEIRNPLGGILGFLGLAERKASPEILGYIVESKLAVKRLEVIVKDLLTFARPLDGIASSFMLSEAWTTLERTEIARGSEDGSLPKAEIAVLPSNLMKIRLKGDVALFDRVIGNVIRNAREAAGKDGKVAMRVRWGDPAIWIEIDDSGPGWPSDISDKLFEPFISTKEDGSGLGLAITSRIVQELGGSIRCMRIDDESGRKITRFRIAWLRSEDPSAISGNAPSDDPAHPRVPELDVSARPIEKMNNAAR